MATDVKLPELGEGVTEGELVKWLVKPGDSVKADQAIAEIMTDKATVEVPSPVAGVVKDLKFKTGDVIKVESIMLTLDGAGAKAAPAPAPTAKPATPAPAAKPAATPAVATGGGGKTIDVKLPELGEGVTEGELVKWLVKPGDSVKADQAIAEIMTDKATVEVPSPVAGVVKDLKFKTGDVVKVESVMLTLQGAGGSSTSPSPSSNGHAPKPAAPSAPAPQSAPAMMSAGASANFYPPAADSKVLATPATRRLAREMGIDINGLSGSGLAGRVTREDVLGVKGGQPAAGATRASSPQSTLTIPRPAYSGPQGASETREPLRGIRKKVAENLQMAKHVIPHFTLMEEAEVTELVALRTSLKEYAEKNKTKVTYLPFVIKALIATIREFPMFNASIDDAAQEIVYKNYFNIGFAADTPQGLLVPVIKDADRKSILEISREIIDLSQRARDGKLKLEEMKGATITITNIGSVGGTYATPIINHPEVAILGMYKIQDKPVIRDGKLEAIKVMNYTITCDHRLIDGAVAARFMAAFVARIQKPGTLMMEMA
jgi:pyruvate dehydrogenase E2 component (dihydrolipoamide acetyltransferase)